MAKIKRHSMNKAAALAKREEKPVSELSQEQLETVTGGSFDIANPTTIGSATGGAGAGKAEFKP